jgi:hypothetical protein
MQRYRRKSPSRRRRRSPSRRRYPSRRRKSSQWIIRPGKLGGPGFLSKSSSEQHRLLDKCVREYGYRSCLGSIMVLQRSRAINSAHGAKLNSLKNYLKRNYGY